MKFASAMEAVEQGCFVRRRCWDAPFYVRKFGNDMKVERNTIMWDVNMAFRFGRDGYAHPWTPRLDDFSTLDWDLHEASPVGLAGLMHKHLVHALNPPAERTLNHVTLDMRPYGQQIDAARNEYETKSKVNLQSIPIDCRPYGQQINAARNEGLFRGLTDGYDQGRHDGLAEGRKEGFDAGCDARRKNSGTGGYAGVDTARKGAYNDGRNAGISEMKQKANGVAVGVADKLANLVGEIGRGIHSPNSSSVNVRSQAKSLVERMRNI